MKLRNLKEFVVNLRAVGSLAVATDIDARTIPFDSTLAAMIARVGSAGTDGTGTPTQDVIVDIKVNGTSILAASPKLLFSHTTPARAPSGYPTFLTNPPTFSKGDVVSLDVTQIFNGTGPVQPKNLSVVLVISRKTSPPSAVITDAAIAGE